MKAMAGVKMSYRLQEILQLTGGTVRGVRLDEIPISLNHYIYSLIRNSRNYRRALLSNTLNMFDDTAVSIVTTLLSSELFPLSQHSISIIDDRSVNSATFNPCPAEFMRLFLQLETEYMWKFLKNICKKIIQTIII